MDQNNAPNSFPSYQEEVERKAVEELQRIVHLHQHARLSTTEAQQCLQTLWQTVAGLVSKETMELMALALKEAKDMVPETAFDDVRIVQDDARGRVLVGLRRRGIFVTMAIPTSGQVSRVVQKGDPNVGAGPEFDAFTKMGSFKKLTAAFTKLV